MCSRIQNNKKEPLLLALVLDQTLIYVGHVLKLHLASGHSIVNCKNLYLVANIIIYTTFILRHRPEYETEWMFQFIKNLSFGLLGYVNVLWVFYCKLKHSHFPYFTSEDMKKYVTHGKRMCFPAGSLQLDLAPF